MAFPTNIWTWWFQGLSSESEAIELLDTHLNKGVDVNSRSRDQRTLLHDASVSGYLKIVERLLDMGADVNAVDSSLNTPLHLAEDIELVRKLVSAGANISAKNCSGKIPLHIASVNDREDVALFLLRSYLEPDASNEQGITRFMSVLISGSERLARHMLDLDADVHKLSNAGENVLHFCSYIYNIELAREIVARGANVNARTKYGMTPVLEACIAVNLKLVRLLVDNGADVFAVDKGGNSTLFYANWYDECEGMDEVYSITNEDRTELTRYLVELGVDVNLAGNIGTPLHAAVKRNDFESVKVLVENGADVNIISEFFDAPLHNANAVIASYLLKNGANVNALDDDGGTVLHKSRIDDTKFELLIDHGADIHAQDHNGKTPLHVAASIGNLDRVCALVKMGASVFVRDKDDNTPLCCTEKTIQTIQAINKLERGPGIRLEKYQSIIDYLRSKI